MKKQLKVLSYVWPLFAGMLFAGCDCLDCMPNALFNVIPGEVTFEHDQTNEPQIGKIASSCDWRLANPDQLPGWLEVTPQSGRAPSTGITITMTAPNTGPGETYTLVFQSSCGEDKEIVVTRKGVATINVRTNNPDGGTVLHYINREAGDYTATVPEGTTVTLIAVANEGYVFSRWEEADGTTLAAGEEYTEYAYIVNQDVTVYAVFTAEDVVEYTLTVGVFAGQENMGTVENPKAQGNWGALFEDLVYESGSNVSINAAPTHDGYVFSEWVDGDGNHVSSLMVHGVTMDGDKVLYAKFSPALFDLTVAVGSGYTEMGSVEDPANSGSYGLSYEGSYTYGSAVTVTARPNEGHTFMGWLQDGNIVSTAMEYEFQLTGDTMLHAVFTADPVVPPTYTVTVKVFNSGADPGDIMNNAENEFEEEYTIANIEGGTEIEIGKALPEENWLFQKWAPSGDMNASLSNNIEGFTYTVTADTTIYAVFEPAVWLILEVASGQHEDAGYVGETGEIIYREKYPVGTSVTATAIPGVSAFEKWADIDDVDAAGANIISTSVAYTFTLNAHTTLYAVFEPEEDDDSHTHIDSPVDGSKLMIVKDKTGPMSTVYFAKGLITEKFADGCIGYPAWSFRVRGSGATGRQTYILEPQTVTDVEGGHEHTYTSGRYEVVVEHHNRGGVLSGTLVSVKVLASPTL